MFGLDGVDAHQRGFMRFGAIRPNWRASSGFGAILFIFTLQWTYLARRKALSESYATHAVSC
jgi:hypothetical protein